MGPSNQKLMLDLGITLGCTNEGYQLSNGNTVKKDGSAQLIELQKDGYLKFAYKINTNHLLLTGTERQKVRKAAELLSRTVAGLLNILYLEMNILHYHPTNKLKSAYENNLNEQNVSYWEKQIITFSKGLPNIYP
uniref:Uncharacterized protein n=1 Tax=Timema monikensis TaxID=170555 RepID=A0A7R9HPP2_9NEOP|nr:unnamed protein product [Timema monikensis]